MSNWSPNYNKLGPPKNIKPRPYHPTLELLETESNKLCTQDYEQDIYNYLALVEINSIINCSMIDLQPEIQWYMRPYLIDFLVEIHQSFRLHPQTLFLAINIIDKYCSKRVVFKRHYQLVGCTALWLSAKYEDKKSRVPTLKELTIMCRNAYDTEMFVQMERHILSTLEWSLVHTSLEDCLQISLKNSLNFIEETPKKIASKNYKGVDLLSKIESLSRLFCELSLYERNFIQFPTSIISLTCHLLASRILGSDSALESYESSINIFLQNNREIDDDETFDEDYENNYPNVTQPFLSGFNEETMDQIIVIGILLINQFQSCSHALHNKYKKSTIDGFNCIEYVQHFIKSNLHMIQLFPENESFNEIKDLELSLELKYTASFIIGLTSDPNFPNYNNNPNQINTPPSASSAISSIFSINEFNNQNYSTSSINLTPMTTSTTTPMTSSTTSTSSPIDPNHYQAQQIRNVFNSSTNYNPNGLIFKKSHIPSDPEYGTFVNKKRNIDDDEEDREMIDDEPNCPGSSPLAQRSQNKLNMMV